MTNPEDNYPNKTDYLPGLDKHSKDGTNLDELPLSDPAESNSTKVFRENETKTKGENEPSAFGENKNINK